MVERPGDRPAAASRTKPMIKKVVIALCASAIALSATACNTVRGAGNDLESAADAVDKKT
jgi:entericidin B